MDLRHLLDKVLLVEMKKLVSQEREMLTQILHHMKEIDRRKLYADLGYSSLFSYATKELKYSPDQAQRRIIACRLIAELPELEKKIESGAHSLATLGLANNYINNHQLDQKEKLLLLEKIEEKSKREVEAMLAPEKLQPIETEKKVSQQQTKITLILDDLTLDKLRQLQAIYSHSNKRELSILIDHLATEALSREEKALSKTRATKPSNKVRTRHIPATSKKAVMLRAKRRCEYPQCKARHFLQIHHLKPYAEGGTHNPENLRLLCHAHHFRGHR